MDYPKIFRMRQKFDAPTVKDVPAAVREEVRRINPGTRIKAGQTVAITVGSRGVANVDVIAKVINIRDFFVTLFFVSLGLQLELGSGAVLLAAAALSVVVLVSRFLTVGPLLHGLGYGPGRGQAKAASQQWRHMPIGSGPRRQSWPPCWTESRPRCSPI